MTPFDVMSALREAMTRLQSAGTEPWPGYDPGTVPVAIYDGTDTFLFGHPAPPAGFQPGAPGVDAAFEPGLPPVSTFPGLHPAVRGNSVALIGDQLTATIMPTPEVTSVAATAAIVAHEAFHVYQFQHHPGWGADESQALTYPVTSAPLHHLLLMEMEALEQALAAGGAPDRGAPWVRLALDLRHQRHALLPPGAAAYERSVERLEGLAHYVEMHFAAASADGAPSRRTLRFGPAEVRRRSYAAGQVLALLLDRFESTWKARLTQHDTLYLDDMLDQALPPHLQPAAIAEADVKALQALAEGEVEEVAQKREALRSSVVARGGWRLEVIAAPADPLRPKGFDPMNLHPLGSAEVLHTRWLRLGNDTNNIEVFGEVVTAGAGPHPLFTGVARMTVLGLSGAPHITQEADTVTVTGQGIDATFRHAAVTQSGQTVTITLA
jgi:hypothetical protein